MEESIPTRLVVIGVISLFAGMIVGSLPGPDWLQLIYLVALMIGIVHFSRRKYDAD